MKRGLMWALILGAVIFAAGYFLRPFFSYQNQFGSANCDQGLVQFMSVHSPGGIDQPASTGSYLAFRSGLRTRVIDTINVKMFPSFIRPQDAEKFASITNRNSSSAIPPGETRYWNIWVNDKNFSKSDFDLIKSCVEKNLQQLNKQIALTGQVDEVGSIAYVPDALYTNRGNITVLDSYYCGPLKPGTDLIVIKSDGSVWGNGTIPLGVIDANGYFKKDLLWPDFQPAETDKLLAELQDCKNANGQNIDDSYADWRKNIPR